MTFGIGEPLFERFGHGALCLRYPDADPVCFNYGVTDFDAVGTLVWNFLRAQQRFWVEPEGWSLMLEFYGIEDRDIWGQTLPLTPVQARAVEHQLLFDVQLAHRDYIYDHFRDNCTTRLRDMIDDATGGALRAGSEGPYPLTYRQIGQRGLANVPVLFALADFVLGRSLDATPTIWQAMFYPAVLREQVERTLHAPSIALHVRAGPAFPTDVGVSGRLLMLAIALAFALPLLLATWRRRFERVATAWASVYLGAWGLVLWAAAVVSTIPAVRWNEAVLVLVPMDLVLPWLGVARRRRYARGRVVLLLAVSALCPLGVLHQPLWIPILTAMMPLSIIAFELPRAAR